MRLFKKKEKKCDPYDEFIKKLCKLNPGNFVVKNIRFTAYDGWYFATMEEKDEPEYTNQYLGDTLKTEYKEFIVENYDEIIETATKIGAEKEEEERIRKEKEEMLENKLRKKVCK